MGRIDHQLVGINSFSGQTCKYPVEHAQLAPADEAVVDRPVRAVLGWRIAPPQAVPDDEDNATVTRRSST